jgi:hypothetical protein
VSPAGPCCNHLKGCQGIAKPGEKCGLCRIAESQPTTPLGRLVKAVAKQLADREAEIELG